MVHYFYNILLCTLIFNISVSSIVISAVGCNFPSFFSLTSPIPTVILIWFGIKVLWLGFLLDSAGGVRE